MFALPMRTEPSQDGLFATGIRHRLVDALVPSLTFFLLIELLFDHQPIPFLLCACKKAWGYCVLLLQILKVS